MEYYDTSNDDCNIDDAIDVDENDNNQYQQIRHQKRSNNGINSMKKIL